MHIFGLKLKTIKLAGFVVLSFLLLSTAALAVYMNDSAYGRVTGFFEKIISPTENNFVLEFNSPQHFTYNVEKIDVKNRGASLSSPKDTASIINLIPLKIDPGSKIVGFKEKAVKSRGTEVAYQITSDFKAWYYFNGKEWVPAGNCESCVNNEVEINKNIGKFPIKSDGVQIKSFLSNNLGSESQVILKSLEFKIAGRQGSLTKNDADKLLFVRAALAGKDHENKIVICHYPPGNPENPQTIEIDEDAWSAHQEHGDTQGACSEGSPVCGNGNTEEGEQCDDGNVENGDGCSSECRNEESIPVCGNGINDPGEECDPLAQNNNCIENEICSSSCTCELAEEKITICHFTSSETNPYNVITISVNAVQPHYSHHGDIIPITDLNQDGNIDEADCAAAAGPVCGNEIIEEGEQCDDGNTQNGDGCSSACQTEEGNKITICHYPPGNPENPQTIEINESAWPAHQAHGDTLGPCSICGNEILEEGEGCDDGNTENGDGCSSTCQPEEPWDKSNIEVEGVCVEPNVLFTITNTGDPLIGDMAGPSEYRIYRDNTLERTGTFQLAGGQSLQIVFDNALGDKITLQADQRPGHPQGGYAETIVNHCGQCLCNGGISELVVQYVGPQNGVTVNVYAQQGHNPLITTFNNVQFGDILRVSGSGLPAEKLDHETYFEIPNSDIPDSTIPTSCLEEIIDNTYGSFYVVSHTDKHGHFCGKHVAQGPTANDDNATTPFNTPVDIAILANDFDPDGGGLNLNSVTIDTPPLHGIAVYNSATGIVTYTPTNGFTGIDTFTYTVCDLDDLLCDSATVTIGVGTEKFPPIANNDSSSTPINTPVDITILLNDTDLDGTIDPTTVLITILPSNGNVSVNPTTGVVTYTPNLNFIGTDTFSYKVKDNDGLWSNVALVTVNVGAPQGKANNDQATTCRNTSITINVVANDSSNFNPPATLTVTQNPSHGTIESIDLASGKIKYMPDTGFSGNDSFEYRVCDSTAFCDKATVSVKVNICGGGGSNYPPVALPDNATTPINTPVNIDLAANDSDPDGNLDKNSIILISPFALHGVVSILSNGVVTYTPNPDFTGTDTFYYQIFDTTSLFASAQVTVTVTGGGGGGGGGGGTPLPPIARDDAATTTVNTPVTILILANDSDPDGTLVPSTAQVIAGQNPKHGTVAIVNGVATYTPNPGFTGIDDFQYQVCDNDGLCASAKVTIIVSSPIVAPVCGNGILEPSEECDDGNAVGGDGCSLICTIEAPIPALIIQPLVLTPTPPPPPSPGIRIFGQFCGQVYSTPNVTFAGSVDLPIGQIISLEYSLNNGLSWNTISRFTSAGAASTLFNFTVADASPGNYLAVVRANTTTRGIIASSSCGFTVRCDLAIGANQFVLSASQSPMSRAGVVQFEVGKPQTIYLEAKCASLGLIKDTSTQKEYPLSYDGNLKLWTTSLLFSQPGTYSLEALIANDLGESYSRKINTAFVSGNLAVSDAATGQPINRATATIFAKDPATGKFNNWQGSTFQRENPFAIPQGLSVVLPGGEYYVTVTAAGYNSVDSLIVDITQQSVVTANIKLTPRESVLERLTRLTAPGGEIENFTLNVSPLPAETLLPLGKIIPNISAVTSEGKTVNFPLSLGDRPTVVFVYSNWSTAAQEQLDIFKKSISSLRAKYRVIPLSTMEPANINLTQSERGAYNIEFYKPVDQFFTDFFITSLPEFFVLSEQGEFLGSIIGPQSEGALLKAVNDLATP